MPDTTCTNPRAFAIIALHSRPIILITYRSSDADRAQADKQENKPSTSSPLPPDIRSFLKSTGVNEARYMRMLSSLCEQTYYIDTVTVRRTTLAA